MIIKKCRVCGKEFKTSEYKINIGCGKYCGRECYTTWRKTLNGNKLYNWKGGKSNHYGYTIVRNPDYYAGKSKQRYVKEHRVIMEKHLGRKLTLAEEVHHINGIKDDNRLNNLRIVSKSNHNGKFLCPHCQKEIWRK